MKLRVLPAIGILSVMAIAAAAETLHYHGAIGQQQATITVEVEDGAVLNASYRYDHGQADLPFVEYRLLGTTLVLADADGNLFHLHLEHRDGNGAGSLSAAERLQGNMVRDTLELPVDVLRLK